jgi:hypothetical protein
MMKDSAFTCMKSLKGTDFPQNMCPLNEAFLDFAASYARDMARTGVDIIMYDDDLRYGIRGEKLFCCCGLHMAEYRKRIGENISVEELKKYILTGGGNRYRSEFHKLMCDTLTDFARKLRAAVDEINPKIRLGHCGCHDTWDFCGQDNIKMSLAFAGENTKQSISQALKSFC